MKAYLDLKNEFDNNPNLCNWFRLHAYDTWRRIEFARSQWGLRIFETTITQNILYQFAIDMRSKKLPVSMYEAVDERSNGNDIEFEYRFKNGTLRLPMQAKIVYSNGKYPRMKHGAQIETLIDYARREGGYPLYILYNHTWEDTLPFAGASECGVKYDIHQYGISLISAYYLQAKFYTSKDPNTGKPKWTIPYFNNLHPAPAIPWFKLVCCKLESIEDFIRLLHPIRTFPYDEESVANDLNLVIRPKEQIDLKEWKPLELEEFRGEQQEQRLAYEEIRQVRRQEQPSLFESTTEKEEREEEIRIYNPKYRIVLNPE